MSRELRRRLPDGSTWPTVEEADALNWRLRYGDKVSREDALVAASYCAAYADLIRVTEKKRRMVVQTIKKSPTAFHSEGK